MTVRNALHTPVPKSALPDFTPVPRKNPRHDGWTPERQKAFVEALADTGCVAIACRMVNMSQPSYYFLRRQPGAESFRAAAEAAHSLGLQCVKDEAFERAMNGELIPVFVAGKLMGFRRKKNDRLLMWILRHYGQDAQGRKTTINYFSTRATAGAAANPPRDGEGDHAQHGGGGPETRSIAAAEASTTTVKTVISGSPAPSPQSRDTEAANALNAFEGVKLDAEARDQIYRILEACAERRRALEDEPEHDPQRWFIGEEETNGYLGQLESGYDYDRTEFRPEGEHYWESLGEGGNAAEIDEVVAGIEARRAAMIPEELAAEAEASRAAIQADIARQSLPYKPDPDPDDPRLDWRNWDENGYKGPPSNPPLDFEGSDGSNCPRQSEIEPGTRSTRHWTAEAAVEGQSSAAPKARKPYKKRTPKRRFVAPEEAQYASRKAKAIKQVNADRREAAEAEAGRRERRKKPAGPS